MLTTVDKSSPRRRERRDASLEEDLSYWRGRLQDMPPALELPSDRPRTSSGQFRAASHNLALSKQLSASLNLIGNRAEVEIFTVLLAAFQVLLARHTGQEDVVIGCLLPGCDISGGAEPSGSSCNTLIVRTDLHGDPQFSELLQRVKRSTQADREHQVPFAVLNRALHSPGDIESNPLYRVLFSLLKPTPAANVDLEVRLSGDPTNVDVHFIYNRELFDPPTIARLLGHFHTLLRNVAANPDQRVSQVPLLMEAERHQILFEWNDTKREYPRDRCVHELFEEQALRTPHAVAAVFGDQELTYAELNSRSDQLAQHLLALGAMPDVFIGICLERSLNLLITLLGIMKSGAAYVPLDPQYPAPRLSFMLHDSGLKILVTQDSLKNRFRDYGGQLVLVDSKIPFECSATSCHSAVRPENLAYVLYTSGSTGKPKGVQICHRSLVNFLTSMRSSPGLTAEDTWLAVTTISFDIAGLELYLPLIVGARVVLLGSDIASDGNKLRNALAEVKPTVIQATPATWRLLFEAGWKGENGLKILCGGEAMPRELAVELLSRGQSLWNMYGPTETTIWSTISHITPPFGTITIGKPIANTTVRVLDSHLEPVPIGVAGELYIGGEGMARGYLGRPELTAERFILDPFGGTEFETRLYRTGDLARFRPDGEVECLGRIDNQVKVRGFRIELGEIEAALNEYPGLKQNVVVAREDNPGDKRLVAYIVPDHWNRPKADALRQFLKEKLPDYMVPSKFAFLEVLPLTPNGKVDRNALPRPEAMETAGEEITFIPKNSIESRLLKIWQSVLGISRLGVTDDFFELGGHSLLAAKLLARIERNFGQRLPMAVLFEAPTIQQQAAMLQQGNKLSWPVAFLPIQPTGSRSPFFCFGYGAGPVFRPLARRLGFDQPLFGVDPTLLDASLLPADCKMGDIAASLARQISDLAPGPYYLGGFCGGGLIAYETARQLKAHGHRVALVALFEPHTSYYDYQERHANSVGPRWLARKLAFHLTNVRHLGIHAGTAYLRDRMRKRASALSPYRDKLLRKALHSANTGHVKTIGDILYGAYRSYRTQPFDGHVALFQATRREPGCEWEREYWRSLASEMDLHEIPGCSNWLVRFFLEPNVELVATSLSQYLDNSGTGRTERQHARAAISGR